MMRVAACNEIQREICNERTFVFCSTNGHDCYKYIWLLSWIHAIIYRITIQCLFQANLKLHTQLPETRSCYVVQAGLKLLSSRGLLGLVSPAAGYMYYNTWLSCGLLRSCICFCLICFSQLFFKACPTVFCIRQVFAVGWNHWSTSMPICFFPG